MLDYMELQAAINAMKEAQRQGIAVTTEVTPEGNTLIIYNPADSSEYRAFAALGKSSPGQFMQDAVDLLIAFVYCSSTRLFLMDVYRHTGVFTSITLDYLTDPDTEDSGAQDPDKVAKRAETSWKAMQRLADAAPDPPSYTKGDELRPWGEVVQGDKLAGVPSNDNHDDLDDLI